MNSVGISSIGCALPSLSLPLETLAAINGVDPDKYLIGLGCSHMALCKPDENVASLAITAARKAIKAWDGDSKDIGLVAVGTESGNDYSKPLSQLICRSLNLDGAFRSYEVKHACLGGTLAIRQAIEWIQSGAANGKSALVVAADVCTYEEKSASEPTQGGAAIAFVIGKASIAQLSIQSFTYSRPVNDFWRPVHCDFPLVDASLSHKSYIFAAQMVFQEWQREASISDLKKLSAMNFHCPFPKMVLKAANQVASKLGLSRKAAEQLVKKKVEPYLEWNRQVGNAYTASLWLSVINTLANAEKNKPFSAFSYGSGCGAELLFLTPLPKIKPYWAKDIEAQLNNRKIISAQTYLNLRKKQADIPLTSAVVSV